VPRVLKDKNQKSTAASRQREEERLGSQRRQRHEEESGWRDARVEAKELGRMPCGTHM
jgi:hypothetical protein